MRRCLLTHVGRVSTILVCCLRFVALFFALSVSLTAQADTLKYYYDGAGRLVQMTEPGGSVQYRYDNAGNMMEVIRTASSTDPVIAEFSPNSGPVGTVVTIVGQGFASTLAGNTVKFAGTTATVLSASPNSLTVKVPIGASTGKISVKVGTLVAMSAENFQVVTPEVLRIDNFAPRVVALGDLVTITGAGFGTSSIETTVHVNGYLAQIISIIDTRIVCVVSTITTSGKIEVRNSNGSVQATGDLFVGPPGTKVTDIVYTSRIKLNDPPLQLTLLPNQIALLIFEGEAGQGLGLGVSPITIYPVGDDRVLETIFRSPTGVIIPARHSIFRMEYNSFPKADSTDVQMSTAGTHTLTARAQYATIDATISLSADVTGVLVPNGPPQVFTATHIGQNARYKFAARAGDRWSLSWSGSTFDWGRIHVFVDSSVEFAGYDFDKETATSGSTISYEIPQDATYTVAFDPPLSTGQISARLELGKPDFEVVPPVSIGQMTVSPQGSYRVPIGFDVRNVGGIFASQVVTNDHFWWFDAAYLSADATLDAMDLEVGSVRADKNHPREVTQRRNLDLVIPGISTPGPVNIILKLDKENLIAEQSETNNTHAFVLDLPPKADLAFSNFSIANVRTRSDGQYVFDMSAAITNTGAFNIPYFEAGVYLSADAVLDGGDTQIDFIEMNDLLAGGSLTITDRVVTFFGEPGSYHVLIKVDLYENISESNEANNVASKPITLAGKPDLVVSSLSANPPVFSGTAYSVTASYTVKNIGGYSATVDWHDEAFLSTDGVLDGGDVNVGQRFNTQNLAPSASYSVADRTFDFPTGTPTGNYTLFIKTDSRLKLGEQNEDNNYAGIPIVLGDKPDLQIINPVIGAPFPKPDGSFSIQVDFDVKNAGSAAATGTWYDMMFLSTNATLDGTDVYLDQQIRNTPLAAGASFHVSKKVATATNVAPAIHTLFLKTDATQTNNLYTSAGRVGERNENNNVSAHTVDLSKKPNLSLSNLVVGTPTVNDDGTTYSIQVDFTVTNTGTATAVAPWNDIACLSNDGILSTTDDYLNQQIRSIDLAAGASYTFSKKLTTGAISGVQNKTLFVKLDGDSTDGTPKKCSDASKLGEISETDNVQSRAVVLGNKADLVVSVLNNTSITLRSNGEFAFTVTGTIENRGAAAATAAPNWPDGVYLSQDNVLDTNDLYLGQVLRSTDLAIEGNYAFSKPVTIPASQPGGQYFLFLKADGANAGGKYAVGSKVVESNESNNTKSKSITLTR